MTELIAPALFPKLSARAWILLPVLVGLALMPFVLSTVLAFATLALIAAYVTVGPLLIRRPAPRRHDATDATDP